MALIDKPERARQLARVIASDLSMYHEKKIIEGVERDTLFEALRDEIEEGRTLYKSRVTPEIFQLGHLRPRAGRHAAEAPRPASARRFGRADARMSRRFSSRPTRRGSGWTCSWRSEVAGRFALAAGPPDRPGGGDRQRRGRARRRASCAPGDVVVYDPPPVVPTEIAAEALPLTIVHEDRWLVVIDKPAGLVVHPAPGHEAGTLVNALLAHCQDLRGIGGELRPGHRPPHRQGHLGAAGGGQGRRDDERARRPPSRRTRSSACTRRWWRARRPARAGASTPSTGAIRATGRSSPAGCAPASGRSRTGGCSSGSRGRRAWRRASRPGGRTRCACTWRRSGCPLLGDQIYGRPPRDAAVRAIADALGRQALHARVLGFVHPATGKQMSFTSAAAARHAGGAGGAARAIKDGCARSWFTTLTDAGSCRCCGPS